MSNNLLDGEFYVFPLTGVVLRSDRFFLAFYVPSTRSV